MSSSVAIAVALLAGIMNGSFATPTKYTTRWKWENIWALWGLVAFFLFPWVLALLTVPHLFSVYSATDTRTLFMLIVFGALYGFAVICFGLGVDTIGIALNFAIALGLSTAVGSLVPLFSARSRTESSAKLFAILSGIALVLAGIICCAIAGRAKERRVSSPRRTGFGIGLLFAIVAGVGSPLLNFGLAFGGPLVASAASLGASVNAQANALWPPILTATAVPYLAYCAYLWRKNGTMRLFAAPGTGVYWILGAVMGMLWMGSIALYGSTSTAMGAMGPVLGWPLFMSAIILTSNAWGFFTGEWRGAPPSAVSTMRAGMALLILGFCALAYSVRVG